MIIKSIFVKIVTHAGTKETTEPEVSNAQKKKMSLRETRRSLPIWPFRDELLDGMLLYITRSVSSLAWGF